MFAVPAWYAVLLLGGYKITIDQAIDAVFNTTIVNYLKTFVILGIFGIVLDQLQFAISKIPGPYYIKNGLISAVLLGLSKWFVFSPLFNGRLTLLDATPIILAAISVSHLSWGIGTAFMLRYPRACLMIIALEGLSIRSIYQIRPEVFTSIINSLSHL